MAGKNTPSESDCKSKLVFRFYKGEEKCPFRGEQNASLCEFWKWEWIAATWRYHPVNPEAFFDTCKDDLPDFIKEWDASIAEKGLLLWMMLMCGKWDPYSYPEIDWALYTKPNPLGDVHS